MFSQHNWTTPEATAQAGTHVLRNKKAMVVLAFKCQHAFAHGFIFNMNVCSILAHFPFCIIKIK